MAIKIDIGGIYIFRRVKDNSPVYVGQTSNIDNLNYLTSSVVLLSKLKKNGKKWFWNYYKKEYLCYIPYNKEKLNILETFFINFYKTHKNFKGYNYNFGGDGNKGYKFTKEQKLKVSNGVKNNRIKNPLTKIQKENYSKAVKEQHRFPSKNRLDGRIKAAQKLKGKPAHNKIIFTKEQTLLIIELLNNKISLNKISKELKCSRPTLSKYIKEIRLNN